MRIYLATVLVYTWIVSIRAGYFTSECVQSSIWYNDHSVSRQDYDVTDDTFTIYSHDDYGYFNNYPDNYRRCINIWTNRTDYVIKLEEEDFHLEDGFYNCDYDYLEIYFTSLDNADAFNDNGKWCGSSGPGTVYSSGNHMFLHFYTDSTNTEKGFEFTISSIHEDDVPLRLSAGAIVAIVFGVLALIIIIILIVACVLIQKKKSGSVHAAPSGASGANNRNVAVVSTTNTMYNRQMVGVYIPPPQYRQLPPAYQTSYGMAPVGQPVGQPTGPPPPPPPAQDTAYPPPAAIYNPPSTREQLNSPPPSYKP